MINQSINQSIYHTINTDLPSNNGALALQTSSDNTDKTSHLFAGDNIHSKYLL